MKALLVLFCVCLCSLIASAASRSKTQQQQQKVSCKTEDGQNVDWFYLYKLPNHYFHNAPQAHNGLRYMYITSLQNDAWILSDRNIDERNSMPALTLQPLYDDPSVLLLAYNDEFPNGTVVADGGHTKGVVATDINSAIWLVHSVPKFPGIPEYAYPYTGVHYGQSFLCLSLSAQQVAKVGEQLIYNEPNVFYSRVPDELIGRFPQLEDVIAGNWRTEAPFFNIMDILTDDGSEFTIFAKNGRYGKDLYSDLVAPALKVNLLVESWRNGAGNLPSDCSKNNKVYNIDDIQDSAIPLNFTTTLDHSKWAVSQKSGFKLWRWRFGGGSDWLCVGDINRQAHQLWRGGGTVCQKSTKLTELYRKLVAKYDQCQN